MKHSLLRWAWLGALSWAVGCSSGNDNTTTTTTGGGANTCEASCDAALELACGKDDKATCLSNCQDAHTKLAQCTTEYDAALSCAIPYLKCAPDGTAQLDEDSLLKYCGKETIAVEGCGACYVDDGASACTACNRTSCCAERQAVYADPSALDYATCRAACTDQACRDACETKFPSIAAKSQAVTDCGTTKCADACKP